MPWCYWNVFFKNRFWMKENFSGLWWLCNVEVIVTEQDCVHECVRLDVPRTTWRHSSHISWRHSGHKSELMPWPGQCLCVVDPVVNTSPGWWGRLDQDTVGDWAQWGLSVACFLPRNGDCDISYRHPDSFCESEDNKQYAFKEKSTDTFE